MTDEFEQFLWVEFLPLFAAPRGDRPRRERDFLAHLWTTAAEAGSAIGIRASAFLIALPTRPWSASATSHAVEKSSMSTQSFSAMCAGLPHVAMSSVRRFASNEYVPSSASMRYSVTAHCRPRHQIGCSGSPQKLDRRAVHLDWPIAPLPRRPQGQQFGRAQDLQAASHHFPSFRFMSESKALHGGQRGVQRFPCSGVHRGCSAGAASVQRASSEACSVCTSP